MPDEKALCSLVETRSYRHCLERLEIWKWILEAIRDDEWIDEVAAGAPAYACGLLQPIKNGFDPSKTPWGRNNTASEVAFDKWLKETKLKHQFPAQPKRRAGRKPAKRNAIQAYIDQQYDGTLPPDITCKHVAQAVGASESSVQRALGRRK